MVDDECRLLSLAFRGASLPCIAYRHSIALCHGVSGDDAAAAAALPAPSAFGVLPELLRQHGWRSVQHVFRPAAAEGGSLDALAAALAKDLCEAGELTTLEALRRTTTSVQVCATGLPLGASPTLLRSPDMAAVARLPQEGEGAALFEDTNLAAGREYHYVLALSATDAAHGGSADGAPATQILVRTLASLPPAPAVRVEADDTRIVLHCRLLEHAGDAEVHYEASAQIIGEWGNADARASLLNAAAEAPMTPTGQARKSHRPVLGEVLGRSEARSEAVRAEAARQEVGLTLQAPQRSGEGMRLLELRVWAVTSAGAGPAKCLSWEDGAIAQDDAPSPARSVRSAGSRRSPGSALTSSPAGGFAPSPGGFSPGSDGGAMDDIRGIAADSPPPPTPEPELRATIVAAEAMEEDAPSSPAVAAAALASALADAASDLARKWTAAAAVPLHQMVADVEAAAVGADGVGALVDLLLKKRQWAPACAAALAWLKLFAASAATTEGMTLAAHAAALTPALVPTAAADDDDAAPARPSSAAGGAGAEGTGVDRLCDAVLDCSFGVRRATECLPRPADRGAAAATSAALSKLAFGSVAAGLSVRFVRDDMPWAAAAAGAHLVLPAAIGNLPNAEGAGFLACGSAGGLQLLLLPVDIVRDEAPGSWVVTARPGASPFVNPSLCAAPAAEPALGGGGDGSRLCSIDVGRCAAAAGLRPDDVRTTLCVLMPSTERAAEKLAETHALDVAAHAASFRAHSPAFGALAGGGGGAVVPIAAEDGAALSWAEATPVQLGDADDSQRRAVAHASLGRSYVLRGPPGCGKTHTLGNVVTALVASRQARAHRRQDEDGAHRPRAQGARAHRRARRGRSGRRRRAVACAAVGRLLQV